MPTNEIFEHVYVWEAPERYWTPKDRDWFLWRGVMFAGFIFLATVTEQFLLIIALIALLILLYVQAIIPPRMSIFEVTNQGIKAFDMLFPWKEISHYWVTEKEDRSVMQRIKGIAGSSYRMINFDMPDKNPARLSLLIGDNDERELIKSLDMFSQYASSDETSDDILSRLIYGKHIPLRSYSQTIELYPETDKYPEQQIAKDDDVDTAEVKSDEKEKKKKKSKKDSKKSDGHKSKSTGHSKKSK